MNKDNHSTARSRSSALPTIDESQNFLDRTPSDT
jgi:hypothetical protein